MSSLTNPQFHVLFSKHVVCYTSASLVALLLAFDALSHVLLAVIRQPTVSKTFTLNVW